VDTKVVPFTDRRDALSVAVATRTSADVNLKLFDMLGRLAALKANHLQDCTLQLWLPEKESEKHFYLNDDIHGIALADLPVEGDGSELLRLIMDACKMNTGFATLSAIGSNSWPILLTACRHYRLPIPPQFWIAMLISPEPAASADSDGSSLTVEGASSGSK
jgi:hypothetical protein